MDPHAPPPPPPPPPQESVKVEKIDLTEDDEEASLDSTLCHVAEYEGGYDGSNSGLEQMPILSAAELGGCKYCPFSCHVGGCGVCGGWRL